MARKQLDPSEKNPLNQTREIRALRKQIEDLTPVATTNIADDAVTFAKMQNIATDRLIGRDTADSGDPEEITVAEGIEFSGSAGIRLADNGVTNAKLADMAASTIKGRATASTGDPEDLTGPQVRAIAGLATTNSPHFAALEIGHASDTTVSRPSAGDLNIEGNRIYRAGGTDVALGDGGTGASLTDPNADRIMFWDDSAGAVTWLTVGANLTVTGTTIEAEGGQPIPSSSTYALGTMALLLNNSGAGFVVSGATIAGSSLLSPLFDNDATPIMTVGAAQSGTWTNISGASVAGTGTSQRIGYFVRTA